jgi:hypothetical protein
MQQISDHLVGHLVELAAGSLGKLERGPVVVVESVGGTPAHCVDGHIRVEAASLPLMRSEVDAPGAAEMCRRDQHDKIGQAVRQSAAPAQARGLHQRPWIEHTRVMAHRQHGVEVLAVLPPSHR